MPNELNTPNHRWYQKRYNIPLAKQDYSRQYIYSSGIAKIDAWIDLLQGRDYSVLGFEPLYVADFDDENYRADGQTTVFNAALTHSRASNATMVDSDGVLKWAPHNLLRYSEQFDNAAWTELSGRSIVTPNDTSAPDGSVTGDRFTNTSDLAVPIYQGASITGIQHTLGVWLKAGTGTWACLRFTASEAAWFNLSTGQKGSEVNVTSTITADGDWYYCTITGTPSVDFALLHPVTEADLSIDGVDNAYAYIWGAHLYRSDLGGMVDNPDRGDSYVPTTSSAVYLPRRGHHVYNGSAWVNEGVLHESEARTNLLTQSQDMTNAAWTTFSTNVTTTSVGNNTFNVVPSATTTQHRTSFDEDVAVSAGTYTLSVEAKANGYDYLGLTLYDGSYDAIVVSLIDGTVSQVQGTATYTVQDVGNGFWRVSLTGVLTADLTDAARASGFWPKPDASTSASSMYLADGTSGVLLRYPQLEAGSTPSSCIPTSGATVTRAADSLTIPAANLPWPTPEYIGPELVTNGTFDTDTTGWTNDGMVTFEVQSGRLRITANANADNVYQDITTVAGKTYLLSFDYEQVGGDSLFDGSGIQWINGAISGTGSITHVFVGTGTDRIQFQEGGTSNNADFYLDNISVREINPLAVSIQMDGRMTYADEGAGSTAKFLRWELDSNNLIDVYLRTDGAATGGFIFRQKDSAVSDVAETSTTLYTPDILVPFNIASRHGSTFINGAVDGTALTADTTPVALPDLSATDLSLGYDYMGTIRTFRIWADDITDAGIAEATEPSLVPSLSLTFDGTENSFIVEDWSE